MRTIAIVLGDNDFGSTFQALLETIKRVIEYRGGVLSREASPENIEFIIRQSVMSHYLAFQYRFALVYGHRSKEEHLAHLTDYLGKIKVLFDDVAESSIATEDHDSGAWYLEIQSGQIASY
jgi:hypothetical protein